MKSFYRISSLALLFVTLFLAGCDKTKEYPVIIPPTQAHFLNQTISTYYVSDDPNSVFKVPVGLTKASDKPTVINISVSSSTGAALGTQYTVPVTSVTIPAGQVIDSFAINGLFSGYATGRIDTLTLEIQSGDAPASDYNKTFQLILRKYCAVNSDDLIGDYTSTRDYYTNIPSAETYTATISSWTSTGATTATIKILNLGATSDIGFGPFLPTDGAATGITAMLDWTNPANFTIAVPSQPYVASLYSYGASTISGTGTFSSCDQTFTINYSVKVSAGSFTGQSSVLRR